MTAAKTIIVAAAVLLGGAAKADPPLCVPAAGGGFQLDREALAARVVKSTLKLGLGSLSDKGLDRIEAAGPGHGRYSVILRAILSHDPGDDPARLDAISDPAARIHVRGYLIDHAPSVNGVAFPADLSWRALYLTDPAPPIACDPAQVAKPPVATAVAAPASASETAVLAAIARVRVRGTPDQLVDDRSAPAFKGDAAATFNVLRDGVARTTTYKVVGALGYAIKTASPDEPLADTLVAFVNINYADTAAFVGASKPPQSNEHDVGLIGARFFPIKPPGGGGATGGVWLSARPDYLWDDNDHSQLFTGNLVVTPLVGLPIGPHSRLDLNGFHQFGAFFVEPVVALKFDGGVYVRSGSNAPAARQSAVARAGGQIGVNVVSDQRALPLTLNAAYVYLDNLEPGKNIGYLTTALTFSLDAKKYVGVTLSYNNGALEATGKRQEQATVGLSVKY